MHVRMELDGDEYDLYLAREGDTIKVEIDGETYTTQLGEAGHVTLGEATYAIQVDEDAVTVDGTRLPLRILQFQAGVGPGGAGAAKGARIKTPMPGQIVSLDIKEGDTVTTGQVLLVLEAMKMQNEITAPTAGTVKKVNVKPGQNVEGKDVLVEIE